MYSKNEWIDQIEDVDSGEVLQTGTLYCARLMNNIEDGIENAHLLIIDGMNKISSLETKVKVLEDNLVNNMPQNNFLEDFSNIDDVVIISGIYDGIYKRIYA